MRKSQVDFENRLGAHPGFQNIQRDWRHADERGGGAGISGADARDAGLRILVSNAKPVGAKAAFDDSENSLGRDAEARGACRISRSTICAIRSQRDFLLEAWRITS